MHEARQEKRIGNKPQANPQSRQAERKRCQPKSPREIGKGATIDMKLTFNKAKLNGATRNQQGTEGDMKFSIKHKVTQAIIVTVEYKKGENKWRMAINAAFKPSADLSSADLSFADLSSANLRFFVWDIIPLCVVRFQGRSTFSCPTRLSFLSDRFWRMRRGKSGAGSY